jgi:hypothetical protein
MADERARHEQEMAEVGRALFLERPRDDEDGTDGTRRRVAAA